MPPPFPRRRTSFDNFTRVAWVCFAFVLTLVVPSGPALSQSPEPGLVVWWDFSSHRQQGTSIVPGFGGPRISPTGSWSFIKDNPPSRVELPGTDERLLISSDVSKMSLPRESLTIESWVRVDELRTRAAILSARQSSDDSPGFALGHAGDRFTFILATESTTSPVVLTADQPLSAQRWYHVAGTYESGDLRLYVDGKIAAQSTVPIGKITYPVSGMVLAGAAPNEEGELDRLKGAMNEIRIYNRALPSTEIGARHLARQDTFPKSDTTPLLLEIACGPFVDWRDRTTAEIYWETDAPMPTHVVWEAPGETSPRVIKVTTAVNQHRIVVDKLKQDVEHFYTIHAPDSGTKRVLSRRYMFDTSFHYAPRKPLPIADTVSAEEPRYAAFVKTLLTKTTVRQGYAYVLGAVDGRMALELVRQSDLQVVVVERDAKRVQAARKLLDRAGVYGVRASVHHVPGDQLPFGELTANLIVSESLLHDGEPPAWSAVEVKRILRPAGGTVLLATASKDFPASGARVQLERWGFPADISGNSWTDAAGTWLVHTRPQLEGAGEWTHQYGSPDNSGTSMDEIVRGEMNVAWWGDPGPRPMPDRGNRNPAPLSSNGRLYIQGDRVLFGLDAYNGAILWTTSSPEMRRANIPRDSSNMVADDSRLYIAQGRWVIAYDGQTGARTHHHIVPGDNPEEAFWGYLGSAGGFLLGSRISKESAYRGDDGEWYEDFAPEQTSRVTSDRFFAIDPNTGEVKWTYQNGLIMNSTISIGEGMVFFIESRNPALASVGPTRLPSNSLTETWLVALDLQTGRRLWHKAQDVASCEFMTYMVHSGNTLLVTGTDRNKHFHSFAFHAPSAKSTTGGGDDIAEAEGGRLLWKESHKEDKGHHSGHLQHPLVIDGTFYSDQRAFNLRTGELLRSDLPERRGCGVMSASRHAVFFRHHFHGMWDLETDKRSQFEGIRGGCWLGLIPAGGMLLAPESSAGCSCTHAIQTSVGYIPASFLRR